MPRPVLTQERLKELLRYDPETGHFTWLAVMGTNKFRNGQIAGSLHSQGYVYIGVDNCSHKAHRLAWLYMEGYWPEHIVEHRDRIRNNNKWDNLRHVTQACNVLNAGIRKDNRTGVTGVQWFRGKWVSLIRVKGPLIKGGVFDTLEEAAMARWKLEVKYNFPNCNTTSSARCYLVEKGLLK